MQNQSTLTNASPPVRFSPLRVVVGLGLLGLLYWLGSTVGEYVPQFAEWVDDQGAWGPAVFILGYALLTVAFVSGALLTLTAGAIFGIVEGTLYVFVAATLGASIAFLVARYLARSAVEARIRGDDRFTAIDRAIGGEGRKIVFLLRLVPFLPFILLNYALGLTRVRFVDYLLASVGMLPATVVYVYYGKVLGEVAAIAGGVEIERGPADYAMLAAGLVAAIAVSIIVTRVARRALAEATDKAESHTA
ncbi:MAG: TVP38/TMEM64 family protein [Myxococcales bacterium]|nr:TVP38/TMEM64 family protein [Myxococcales bacterium]